MDKKTKKSVDKKELYARAKKEYKALIDEKPFNVKKANKFNIKYEMYTKGKKFDIEISKIIIKVIGRIIKKMAEDIKSKKS